MANRHAQTRRHHNNKGCRQIQRGKTVEQVERIAKKLGIPTDIDVKREGK